MAKKKTQEEIERHKITQEVFTPQGVVESMLSGLPDDTFDISHKVLDNSCGEGNILLEVLKRKLSRCKNLEQGKTALKSIYGVEFMADNVMVCRQRLYDMFIQFFPDVAKDFIQNFKVRQIIRNRIQWHDALTFDYDNWPKLVGRTPDKKHMNISFRERASLWNKSYPMWCEEENI